MLDIQLGSMLCTLSQSNQILFLHLSHYFFWEYIILYKYNESNIWTKWSSKKKTTLFLPLRCSSWIKHGTNPTKADHILLYPVPQRGTYSRSPRAVSGGCSSGDVDTGWSRWQGLTLEERIEPRYIPSLSVGQKVQALRGPTRVTLSGTYPHKWTGFLSPFFSVAGGHLMWHFFTILKTRDLLEPVGQMKKTIWTL